MVFFYIISLKFFLKGLASVFAVLLIIISAYLEDDESLILNWSTKLSFDVLIFLLLRVEF